MPPRIILYTGKGGVGKTSVAACTALRLAAGGARTLVLSTDPAHSLSAALESELKAGPRQVAEHLWAQEVQAQEELERHWSAVSRWLGDLLSEHGVKRIAAEEITVPPGGDELFALLHIKRHHEQGDWDAVIVDCAPTGETLRLLSFPEVARWWLEKVVPWEGQLVAAARPIVRTFLDAPMPGEAVFADVQRLTRNLIAMNDILRDRDRVSVRLVMTPERMVIDEAMRTFTYLNLYGYLTDAVVVNRIFPAEVGEYFSGWRRVQQEHLALVESAFAPVPVLRAPYFEAEVTGPAMLERLAGALYREHDPAAVLHARLAHELVVDDGRATLQLELPLAVKGDVSLKKIGLELVVRVGTEKRTILLPPALTGYRAAGARFADGSLHVAFEQGRPSHPVEA